MSSIDHRETGEKFHARSQDTSESLVPETPSRVRAALVETSAPENGHYKGGVTLADQPRATQPTAAVAAQPTAAVAARIRQLTYSQIEQRIIDLAVQWFEPAARIAIFIIYFWFGILKVIGVSPAFPLAQALTAHTIGIQYFNASFKALAVYECGLGILFLFPAMTRLAIALLVIHMGIVISPLVIVANVAWLHPLVPTLEGQYIIKNLAIIALGIGLVAMQKRSPREQQASS